MALIDFLTEASLQMCDGCGRIYKRSADRRCGTCANWLPEAERVPARGETKRVEGAAPVIEEAKRPVRRATSTARWHAHDLAFRKVPSAPAAATDPEAGADADKATPPPRNCRPVVSGNTSLGNTHYSHPGHMSAT